MINFNLNINHTDPCSNVHNLYLKVLDVLIHTTTNVEIEEGIATSTEVSSLTFNYQKYYDSTILESGRISIDSIVLNINSMDILSTIFNYLQTIYPSIAYTAPE
jgi:hypothetical protein